ncbi:MAG: FAD-dependent oxidoreductase [Bacteroidetes bacterium]|nr:MAG: FAD-dependent oxidoreductase [Bacteroidota bacterium]
MAGNKNYDVVVVGSGPNGLAAAITMQQVGLSVLLLEGKSEIGGGVRTAELTLPGFKHDICSAIYPLTVASPFFNKLPLKDFGLEFIWPTIAAAHPFANGSAAFFQDSVEYTAHALKADEKNYIDLVGSVVEEWPKIVDDILGPLHFPTHPLALSKFGLKALQPSTRIARKFSTEQARGLWAGMAAHAVQPLSNIATTAFALVLMAAGHLYGWPLPRGGAQSISNALEAYFISLGGEVEKNFWVNSLDQLPPAKAILFDITPKQLMQIAGDKLSSFYRSQLSRFRYGMGVFKIDWALDEPVPFLSHACRSAGTVHLGNSFEEIARSEYETSKGKISEKPFVLFAQHSVFDNTRAPQGKHTAWAYCHVPNGSTVDMTNAIESQVERFAPGFRETILDRHTFNSLQLEEYNPNYIGGDINGGIIDITQLFTRPVLRWSPYRTSNKGIYLCSSSTPPGGGVHGMCGYHAAKRALKDVFDISL